MTDASVTDAFSLLPSDFCEASSRLNSYVGQLTTGLGGGTELVALGEHAIAGNVAAASLLAVGGSIVLAPLAFGDHWLRPILTLIALLLGLISSAALLGDSHHNGLLIDLWLELPWCLWPCLPSGLGRGVDHSPATCAFLFGMQLFIAIAPAVLVTRMPIVAFFAIGFSGAGAASFFSLGAIRDISTELPFCVWPCKVSGLGKGIAVTFEAAAPFIIGCVALCGGLFLAVHKDGPVDLMIGLLGGALVAQGAMQILTLDVLSSSAIEAYGVADFYQLYVLALAVIIEGVRFAATPHGLPYAAGAKAQLDYAPGATLMGKVAKVSAKTAGRPPPMH